LNGVETSREFYGTNKAVKLPVVTCSSLWDELKEEEMGLKECLHESNVIL
jgi:hypothetical protein